MPVEHGLEKWDGAGSEAHKEGDKCAYGWFLSYSRKQDSTVKQLYSD